MRPTWATRLPWDIIDRLALQHGLEPNFVAAVIQTESGGNPYAIRCEVKKLMDESGRAIFQSLWGYFDQPDARALDLGCSSATEWIGQLTSWGPMQVMGTVAREHGFKGWFPELCTWELGILSGCKHLKRKAQKYGTDPETLYAAFNAGAPRMMKSGMLVNQVHVDRFMGIYRQLRP